MKIESYVPNNSIFENNFGENKTNILSNISSTSSVEDTDKIEGNNGISFSDTLKSALDGINDKQIQAEELSNNLIKGGEADIADVMLAGEEAKISLQYAVQVRNKLLSAYDEIIKMQL